MTDTRVCIFGAGAVGSHIAAKLLRAGQAEVSVVARGPHLAAMRDRGLTFRNDAETFTVPVPRATDDPAGLPPQDVVLVTLKAPALPAVAGALAGLLAPDGVAVFLLNGIPWWWRHGMADAGPLPLLDPDGALWNGLGPQRAVGGVIYSPNELAEPGVVVHSSSKRNRFVLGEPDGSASARVAAVAALFNGANLPAEVSGDIRRDIWRKLLLNASGNPLAALTRLPGKAWGTDPDLVGLSRAIIGEVLEAARATGCDLMAEVADAGSSVGVPVGVGRPSMLQDVLGGRPTEVESLLGQVQLFARESGVATPVIDVILPVMRGLDRARLIG